MFLSNIVQDGAHRQRIIALSVFVVLSAVIAAGWFGYSWYKKSYEQAAYKDLAQTIDSYYKMMARSASAQEWPVVEQAFATAAQRHSKSSLYPYFLAYQADALLAQNKLIDAIALMDTMLNKLNSKQQLYPLYALKRARMKLDSADNSLQQQGRQELEQLAQDTQNPMHEAALYYNGLDLWYKNQKEKARELWNKLKQDSVWFSLAQAKVAYKL